jgi:putative ABC transport system ATP-binding protein
MEIMARHSAHTPTSTDTSLTASSASTAREAGGAAISDSTKRINATGTHNSVSHNDDGVVAYAANLSKTYGTKDAVVTALDHVNVEFGRGQMTAIMGPSGSGKSTLMHCMAGLDTPTSGQVFVEGLEVSAMNQRQLTDLRRKEIGFIFQSFNLVPTLTAEENILLPLQISRKPIDRAWFDQIVRVVGLKQRLGHRPSQLSGGQQQRVACARAMMARPSVIFADEPTGNLDSRSSREVLSFLQDSVREYGQSIVMVTHDPRAASYANRVLVLADGQITQDMHEPSYEQILQVFASEGDDEQPTQPTTSTNPSEASL